MESDSLCLPLSSVSCTTITVQNTKMRKKLHRNLIWKREERHDLRNFLHCLNLLFYFRWPGRRTFLLFREKNQLIVFLLCCRWADPLGSKRDSVCRRLFIGGFLSGDMRHDCRFRI